MRYFSSAACEYDTDSGFYLIIYENKNDGPIQLFLSVTK
jgi:hypothetical protein